MELGVYSGVLSIVESGGRGGLETQDSKCRYLPMMSPSHEEKAAQVPGTN